MPIIALTANAFKEDVDACMAAGMNRFVGKPIRREVLLNAMLAELPAVEISQTPPPPTPPPTEQEGSRPVAPAFNAVELDDTVGEPVGEMSE